MRKNILNRVGKKSIIVIFSTLISLFLFNSVSALLNDADNIITFIKRANSIQCSGTDQIYNLTFFKNGSIGYLCSEQGTGGPGGDGVYDYNHTTIVENQLVDYCKMNVSNGGTLIVNNVSALSGSFSEFGNQIFIKRQTGFSNAQINLRHDEINGVNFLFTNSTGQLTINGNNFLKMLFNADFITTKNVTAKNVSASDWLFGKLDYSYIQNMPAFITTSANETTEALIGQNSSLWNEAKSKTNSSYNSLMIYGYNSSTPDQAYTDTKINSLVNSTITRTIASGTTALSGRAITRNNCSVVITTSATGALTTDSIAWAFNSTSLITQAQKSSWANLTIDAYPTADNVNFVLCNPQTSSSTNLHATINWRITR